MNIAIINGPNLNLLGKREPNIYGTLNYSELCEQLAVFAAEQQIAVQFFQSNHEGAIIDFIQECHSCFDAIIINAGAYTHSSIAILDALLAVNLPTIEVHLSKIEERENFRQVSYLRQACLACYSGEGIDSYKKALSYLKEKLNY